MGSRGKVILLFKMAPMKRKSAMDATEPVPKKMKAAKAKAKQALKAKSAAKEPITCPSTTIGLKRRRDEEAAAASNAAAAEAAETAIDLDAVDGVELFECGDCGIKKKI